jgi:hypothetical protein
VQRCSGHAPSETLFALTPRPKRELVDSRAEIQCFVSLVRIGQAGIYEIDEPSYGCSGSLVYPRYAEQATLKGCAYEQDKEAYLPVRKR